MFADIIAPILGCLFISLALIHFSSSLNPSLHFSLNNQLKQIQENIPIELIREISFDRFQLIYSISLLICGFLLHFFEGIKRLFVLIPLTILSILMVQSTVIYGLSLSTIPVYVLIIVCIIIILFNDCSELEEIEMK